ncbi:hypothetical protein HYE66_12170 [Aggregatibacter actinomycetemcomitans]|nr:hypothetical protein [Aggregatibacter actinomycetemcomitans]
MKKILLLLSIFCLLGCSEEDQSKASTDTPAQKDNFVVGKQNIVVPTPKELAPVTPELGKVYQFYALLQENITKSSNGLVKPFKHYVSLSDLQEQRKMTRNCYIAQNAMANEALGDEPLTDAQFKGIVEPIKQPQNRKTFLKYADKMSENMNKSFNQDGIRQLGVDIDIKNIKLADDEIFIIDEQPQVFAWIVPMSMDVHSSTSNMLVSSGILNLKGKLIYAYCYAMPDELEWLRDVAMDWNQKLLEENK